jgi:predicted RNase H-like nuclease (RuvC/YqgF family)
MSNEELMEKVSKVDELVDRYGLTLQEACRRVGITPKTYFKLKHGLDPKDPQKEETEGGGGSAEAQQPPKTGSNVDLEGRREELKSLEQQLAKEKSDIEEVDRRIKSYVGERLDHPLVKLATELKEKVAQEEEALKRTYAMLGWTPAAGSAPTPAPTAGLEQQSEQTQPAAPTATSEAAPVDSIEALKRDIETIEEKRRKLKETFEKLGFKVEDMYMRRDEFERRLAEERQKMTDDALDDRRIKAVENIVNRAIDKIAEMFKPAVDIIVQQMIMQMQGRGQASTQLNGVQYYMPEGNPRIEQPQTQQNPTAEGNLGREQPSTRQEQSDSQQSSASGS